MVTIEGKEFLITIINLKEIETRTKLDNKREEVKVEAEIEKEVVKEKISINPKAESRNIEDLDHRVHQAQVLYHKNHHLNHDKI